ncbi:MAG: TonB-dependent receptor [Acidobacteriota bacterium]
MNGTRAGLLVVFCLIALAPASAGVAVASSPTTVDAPNPISNADVNVDAAISSNSAEAAANPTAAASPNPAPAPAPAPGPAKTEEGEAVIEDSIVVTGSRREQRQSELTRTTTVIDSFDLNIDLAKSSNIGDALGRSIPGYGAPTFIDLIRNQTLRGREPQYLFDGVPLVYNGGAGFAESPLVKFETGVIDRVEVLYGPTSNYGAGATGGVIQFLTRGATDDRFRAELRQQATTYTGASSPFDSDALSFKTSAVLSGRLSNFDYLLSGSYDSQNGVFDGEGDIANPVYYGFTDDTSYFGKLGLDITSSQRIEGFYSFVDRELDGRVFDTVLRDDGFATGTESPNQTSFNYGSANEPIDEKSLLSFRYLNADLGGGELMLQYYDREDEIIGAFVDLRAIALPPVFPNNYQKTQLDSSEGFRSHYTRSFGSRVDLLVGFDSEQQTRGSRALVFDVGPNFDLDRDLTTPIRDDLFLYPFDLDTEGYFLQLDYRATDSLLLSGGVRYEDVEFEIGSGVRVFDFLQAFRPGGQGANSGTAYNIGVTYSLNDSDQIYGSFAQGYEVPSLFNVARLVPPNQPLESSEAIEPQIVDNFELGFRGYRGNVSYSFAAFFSESEFGENFIYDPETNFGEYNRSPEETYGFETIIGWQANARLSVTGTAAWSEGDFDPDGDGPLDFVPQTSLDIQPWKATLEANYRLTDKVTLNGLILTVGNRDRAFDEGTDLYEIEGYTVADLGIDWQLPVGRLLVQVANVFDRAYLAPSSQSYRGNPFFVARVAGAPGRTLSTSFSIDF